MKEHVVPLGAVIMQKILQRDAASGFSVQVVLEIHIF